MKKIIKNQIRSQKVVNKNNEVCILGRDIYAIGVQAQDGPQK